MRDDPYDLNRFVQAQADVYDLVVAELAAGMKRSHWMWFVFPQLVGLGTSAMARRYALGSLAEAQGYLAHQSLGARLRQCTGLVIRSQAVSLHELFGSPDDLKFRSSMTLFAHASPGRSPFHTALNRWCDGAADPRTAAALGR